MEQKRLDYLYYKWKQDKKLHGEEMAKAVDRIIFKVISNTAVIPHFKSIEDNDDFVQEMRLKCFRLLDRVENPTNKRILCYLRGTVQLAIKEKGRTVANKFKKENLAISLTKEYENPKMPVLFDDDILQCVAEGLINGYTHSEIARNNGIPLSQVKSAILSIKEQYAKNK